MANPNPRRRQTKPNQTSVFTTRPPGSGNICQVAASYLDGGGRGLRMASNNEAAGPTPEQMLGLALTEMEYKVEMFNKLTHTCFDKCIEKRYKESELNMGENSCIDRCVSKYFQVTNLVGQLLGANRPM